MKLNFEDFDHSFFGIASKPLCTTYASFGGAGSHIDKRILHQKWRSHRLPNANEIDTKNMKCTWPTVANASPNGTYSTCSRGACVGTVGLALGQGSCAIGPRGFCDSN